LDVGWQEFEDVLNLWLETTGEHLVGLIQYENFKVFCLEETSSHHVVHTSWSSNDDVLALLQNADVFFYDCTTDTSVHLDAKVLTNRVHDESDLHRQFTSRRDNQGLGVIASWVEALEGANGEGSGFARSGLCLKKIKSW
jgi:hypothetical protein